jgi:hypothetical protein
MCPSEFETMPVVANACVVQRVWRYALVSARRIAKRTLRSCAITPQNHIHIIKSYLWYKILQAVVNKARMQFPWCEAHVTVDVWRRENRKLMSNGELYNTQRRLSINHGTNDNSATTRHELQSPSSRNHL